MRTRLIALAFLFVAAACGRGLDAAAPGTTTTTTTSSTTTTVAAVSVTTTTEVPPPPDPLVVWVDAGRADAVRTAAGDFTNLVGIEVEIEERRLDQIERNVVDDILAGTGPDLFVGPHTWLATLVPAEVVGPIGLAARSEEFSDVAIAAFTLGGELYGMPISLTAPALLFNTDLVDAAPIGFAQIKSDCESLGAVISSCVLVPTDDPTLLFPLLTANGAYLIGSDENGLVLDDVGIDNNGAVQGGTFVRDLVVDGFVSGATGRSEAVGDLTAARTAFMIGDLDAVDLLQGRFAPFAATTLPLSSGDTPIPLVATEGVFISSRSAQPEAAATFLRDYLATPGTMQAIYDDTGRLPAYVATATVAALEDPVIAAFLDSAAGGRPLPAVLRIDDVLEVLRQALEGLFSDEADVAALLDDAAESARAILAG